MASSASPAILPISNSQPATGVSSNVDGSATAQSAAPVTTPAFRLFLSRLQESVRRSLSDRRPWSELVDLSAFSRPESLSDANSRVRKNFAYFRVNYLALIAAVLVLSLITHPASLVILLGLLASWCFLYLFRPSDPPLVLFGRSFSDRETLLGLTGITVFVVFLTSVGSLIISAFMIGVALVAAHGAFRVPDDLFLDDQMPGGAATGFLSFLGGGASTGGPTTVLARV
ncbi:PRA1 family protein B2-like [Dendrobium catenatum]|uniref:PRA1 family protein n=1 Tax=Dendrobium catenatum TaxID=906689 RepID=A0A2I0WKG8_9ASPA|nr:PRA1 family protein B2-like [Dendrobium catenatum]PKU76149.1 PRA1 family protein B4 [Dendrobium catenatum]